MIIEIHDSLRSGKKHLGILLDSLFRSKKKERFSKSKIHETNTCVRDLMPRG